MRISRRTALASGAAAIVTGATVAPLATKANATKAALGGEEAQVLALFQQMGDRERASVHFWARFYAGLPDDPELMRRFARGAQS